jgi:hypothetical protein
MRTCTASVKPADRRIIAKRRNVASSNKTNATHHLSPTSAIASATIGLMACAAATSASPPAMSPFSRLATPRLYNEFAFFESMPSAAS